MVTKIAKEEEPSLNSESFDSLMIMLNDFEKKRQEANYKNRNTIYCGVDLAEKLNNLQRENK